MDKAELVEGSRAAPEMCFGNYAAGKGQIGTPFEYTPPWPKHEAAAPGDCSRRYTQCSFYNARGFIS